MLTIHVLFLVLAIICEALAAFSVSVHPRVNLIALGLFFWLLSSFLAF